MDGAISRMAEGLSDLEENILRMALATYDEPKPREWADTAPDLYEAEVLMSYYGLEPMWQTSYDATKTRWPLRDWRGFLMLGNRFVVEWGQAERHRTATAAVAKACARLEDLELVFWQGRGVCLTDLGIVAARVLQSDFDKLDE